MGDRLGSCALLCLLSACAAAPQRSAMLDNSAESVLANESELRIVLYDYVFEFTQTVELAADAIAAAAPSDPEVLRNSLAWKLGAGTQAKRAAFNLDVLIGFVDVWALALQQQQFFANGAGKGLFGESQPIASDAADKLVSRVRLLARSTKEGDALHDGEAIAGDWAREHPIESIRFVRASAGLAMLKTHRRPAKRGMTQSVANLEESMNDVLQRLSLYSERTPLEVLWASQMMATDMLTHPRIEQALDDLTQAQVVATRMLGFVDGVPTLLEDQRAALFADIGREREATLEALQEERALILAALTEERLAVMQEIHAMYQGSLTSLKGERAVVLAELPSTVAESMRRSDETLRSLIDHLLLRIVQMLAAAAAVVGLGWLAFSAWRRRHPGVAPRRHSHPHASGVG